jgi:uncharacterized protein (TIGR03083 family)
MPPIAVERYYAEIEASTETLAGLVHGADLTRQVPTCPEWTLRQLATHVGRAHRWAAEIVGTRSAEFIPFRQVPDGRIPDDPALHAPWLRAGAALIIGAVQDAGSDPVWTFGGPQPATFWARRMAHETAMHRADAQIAAGRDPEFDADVAADAIDEWLGSMSGTGDSDSSADALPDGAVLHVHVTDDGVDGEWLVRHEGSSLTVEPGHGKGDVVVRGPAGRVLLVLLRRVPPDDPQVEVLGDAALLTGWLAGTPF